MKLGIVGSRTFTDYNKFLHYIHQVTQPDLIEEIISGGAPGADSLAERFAKYWDVPIKIIRPDWAKFGKAAGFERNGNIVQASDIILAFWDGESRGTKDIIDKARHERKPTIIIYV